MVFPCASFLNLLFLISLLFWGKAIHPSHTWTCEYTTFLWDDCFLFLHPSFITLNTQCAVSCCFTLEENWPKMNVQEQAGEQGGGKEAAITSESASSDSSVLLLFHPHAVSLSPCLFNGWLAALACHTMKTAQKWLLWKPSPQDASVISASQIYQAAEWHCRSISDCFDSDCIISCHPFFLCSCCICAVLRVRSSASAHFSLATTVALTTDAGSRFRRRGPVGVNRSADLNHHQESLLSRAEHKLN